LSHKTEANGNTTGSPESDEILGAKALAAQVNTDFLKMGLKLENRSGRTSFPVSAGLLGENLYQAAKGPIGMF
jgi:hypothetical protein